MDLNSFPGGTLDLGFVGTPTVSEVFQKLHVSSKEQLEEMLLWLIFAGLLDKASFTKACQSQTADGNFEVRSFLLGERPGQEELRARPACSSESKAHGAAIAWPWEQDATSHGEHKGVRMSEGF